MHLRSASSTSLLSSRRRRREEGKRLLGSAPQPGVLQSSLESNSCARRRTGIVAWDARGEAHKVRSRRASCCDTHSQSRAGYGKLIVDMLIHWSKEELAAPNRPLESCWHWTRSWAMSPEVADPDPPPPLPPSSLLQPLRRRRRLHLLLASRLPTPCQGEAQGRRTRTGGHAVAYRWPIERLSRALRRGCRPGQHGRGQAGAHLLGGLEYRCAEPWRSFQPTLRLDPLRWARLRGLLGVACQRSEWRR